MDINIPIQKMKERLDEIIVEGFTGKVTVHCKDGVPLAVEQNFTERIASHG